MRRAGPWGVAVLALAACAGCRERGIVEGVFVCDETQPQMLADRSFVRVLVDDPVQRKAAGLPTGDAKDHAILYGAVREAANAPMWRTVLCSSTAPLELTVLHLPSDERVVVEAIRPDDGRTDEWTLSVWGSSGAPEETATVTPGRDALPSGPATIADRSLLVMVLDGAGKVVHSDLRLPRRTRSTDGVSVNCTPSGGPQDAPSAGSPAGTAASSIEFSADGKATGQVVLGTDGLQRIDRAVTWPPDAYLLAGVFTQALTVNSAAVAKPGGTGSASQESVFLLRCSNAGQQEWTQTLGPLTPGPGSTYTVCCTREGRAVLVGTHQDAVTGRDGAGKRYAAKPPASGDGFLAAEYDAKGRLMWLRALGEGLVRVHYVVPLTANRYLLKGYCASVPEFRMPNGTMAQISSGLFAAVFERPTP